MLQNHAKNENSHPPQNLEALHGHDNIQPFFRYRVSNVCGTAVSRAAEITIHEAPEITGNITHASKCEGTAAAFSVSANGYQLSYQWKRSADNGGTWTDIINGGNYLASDNNLTVSDLAAGMDQDLFKCQVTGICGFTTPSDSARLTVLRKPYLIRQPENLTACLGEQVTLHAKGGGTEPITYQWRMAGVSVSTPSTDTSLVIARVSTGDAGNYLVRLTNECNQAGLSSDAAELTVNAVPVINLGEDIHLCPGHRIQLNAGSGYKRYEWSTGDTAQKIETGSQQTIGVRVWNESGCIGRDEINIIMDPGLPVLDLGADLSFCPGEVAMLDAGDQYDSYSWSTQSTGQAIEVKSSGRYWVTAARNNSVCTASDTIDLHFTEPFGNDNICLVTTDLTTGQNLIIWEKTPGTGVAAYHIYRQTGIINTYELIGTIPYDDLSIFQDTVADPEQRQWVYKITAVDTCGNESDIQEAIYHKPMFLLYQSSDNGVNLKWEKYEVENSFMDFVSYQIYRGSDSTALNLLTTLSSDLSAFKDTDPNALKYRYFYRIAGVRAEPCYPSAAKKSGTGPYIHSLSNLEDNKLKAALSAASLKQSIPLDIYPNPMTDITTVRFDNPDHTDHRLTIRDFSGRAVRSIGPVSREEIMIQRENLVQGYYIIEVRGKELFRGRLIVQ
jgi:hypothetical protein